MELTRRQIVGLGAVAAALCGLPARALLASESEAPPLHYGQPSAFRPEHVAERARTLAASPFRPPPPALSRSLAKLSYDQYRDIRYRPEASLWRAEELPFELQFFHLGRGFEAPVEIHVVADGAARPLLFSPAMFSYGPLVEERPRPDERLGFSGFRIHSAINRPDYLDEFAVFQGASYFRAVAAGQAYGLSARGLAMATGDPGGEEFPTFRAFWIEQPNAEGGSIVVHALLDGPSTTGAYRFTLRPGRQTIMDVEVTLYPRRRLDQVGLAPLTSMFYFGAHDRVGVDDFRPAVHDSDGLLMSNGSGEWLWRPLINPEQLQVSLFLDRNPTGFGLMQRDRAFQAFQDLEAGYERRPSLWVEPVGDWGAGAVTLFELPTDSEANDNVVAFWRPETPPDPGHPLSFAYRLHWSDDIVDRPRLARVARTMVGEAGAGLPKGITGKRVVVVEFAGPILAEDGAAPTAKVTVGERRAAAVVQPNPAAKTYRVSFELDPALPRAADLRCVLKRDDAPISEVWTCRWPI